MGEEVDKRKKLNKFGFMKKHIANIITGSRIIFSLPLLFIPLTSAWFYALYLLCGFTDMIDGTVARKMGTVSGVGARLDTVTDFVFMVVAFIRFAPYFNIPTWLWIWIGIITIIKFGGAVLGFVRTGKLAFPHTVLNKATGLLLFLLPVTISFIELTYTLPFVCAVATVAAIHERYYMEIRQKNSKEKHP